MIENGHCCFVACDLSPLVTISDGSRTQRAFHVPRASRHDRVTRANDGGGRRLGFDFGLGNLDNSRCAQITARTTAGAAV